MAVTLIFTSPNSCSVLKLVHRSETVKDVETKITTSSQTPTTTDPPASSPTNPASPSWSEMTNPFESSTFLRYHLNSKKQPKIEILARVRHNDLVLNLFSSLSYNVLTHQYFDVISSENSVSPARHAENTKETVHLKMTCALPAYSIRPFVHLLAQYLSTSICPRANYLLVTSSLAYLVDQILTYVGSLQESRMAHLDLLLEITAACYIAAIKDDNFLENVKSAALSITGTATTNTATLGIESAAQAVGQAAAGVAVSAILDVAVTSASIYLAKRKRDDGLMTDREFSTTVKKTVCETSCKFVCGTTGSILGQVFIPVPVVGAFVGGLAGSLIGHGIGKGITYGVFDAFGRKAAAEEVAKQGESSHERYKHYTKQFHGHVPKITVYDEKRKKFIEVYFEKRSKGKDIPKKKTMSLNFGFTGSDSPKTPEKNDIDVRPFFTKWRNNKAISPNATDASTTHGEEANDACVSETPEKFSFFRKRRKVENQSSFLSLSSSYKKSNSDSSISETTGRSHDNDEGAEFHFAKLHTSAQQQRKSAGDINKKVSGTNLTPLKTKSISRLDQASDETDIKTSKFFQSIKDGLKAFGVKDSAQRANGATTRPVSCTELSNSMIDSDGLSVSRHNTMTNDGKSTSPRSSPVSEERSMARRARDFFGLSKDSGTMTDSASVRSSVSPLGTPPHSPFIFNSRSRKAALHRSDSIDETRCNRPVKGHLYQINDNKQAMRPMRRNKSFSERDLFDASEKSPSAIPTHLIEQNKEKSGSRSLHSSPAKKPVYRSKSTGCQGFRDHTEAFFGIRQSNDPPGHKKATRVASNKDTNLPITDSEHRVFNFEGSHTDEVTSRQLHNGSKTTVDLHKKIACTGELSEANLQGNSLADARLQTVSPKDKNLSPVPTDSQQESRKQSAKPPSADRSPKQNRRESLSTFSRNVTNYLREISPTKETSNPAPFGDPNVDTSNTERNANTTVRSPKQSRIFKETTSRSNSKSPVDGSRSPEALSKAPVESDQRRLSFQKIATSALKNEKSKNDEQKLSAITNVFKTFLRKEQAK